MSLSNLFNSSNVNTPIFLGLSIYNKIHYQKVCSVYFCQVRFMRFMSELLTESGYFHLLVSILVGNENKIHQLYEQFGDKFDTPNSNLAKIFSLEFIFKKPISLSILRGVHAMKAQNLS